MAEHKVVVVGAGMAGLVSALQLAQQGLSVTVVDKADQVGGKMRQLMPNGVAVDSGPTVFTMRWVFDQIMASVGTRLESEVTVQRLDVLARHFWEDGSQLDLYADPQKSLDAVARFAGPEQAKRFVAFCKTTRAVYDALEGPFIRSPSPTMAQMMAGLGPRGLATLASVGPMRSLWESLGKHFTDPRMRQLFARYATYCGASPFAAPATLMLIAHVEQAGVWRVTGGMHALAQAMAQAAQGCGAEIRYSCAAREIEVTNARASAVITADGERVRADAIVFNGDASALASGLVGAAAGLASGLKPAAIRSLSALTWTGAARAEGFDLHHHTVFFGAAYRDEFRRIFTDRALPDDPTIYVCAQDRPHTDHPEAERLLILVNAPPCADSHPLSPAEIEQCQSRTFTRLTQAGLRLSPARQWTRTTPADFHGLFPGTGGAIYGAANHGPWAAFQRPAARTKLPGLYLAGGSSHPSAGAPMAALSGGLAAQAILADCASTQRSRPAAISGATSTPSAPTAATP
jgi:1-hydroxycarotenoid 3,4-desaturase